MPEAKIVSVNEKFDIIKEYINKLNERIAVLEQHIGINQMAPPQVSSTEGNPLPVQ